MSREIKFRVWDNNSKIYYYNNIKIFGSGEFSIIDECNGSIEAYNGDSILSDLILEQCTGLKDKNGKEIYFRSDKIRLTVFDDFTGENTIMEGYLFLDLKRFKISLSGYEDFNLLFADEMEIIGNIHEDHDKL